MLVNGKLWITLVAETGVRGYHYFIRTLKAWLAALVVLPGVVFASPIVAPDTPVIAQNWAITRVFTQLSDIIQETVARLIAPTEPYEPAFLAHLTDIQKWKLFLYQHSLSEGLTLKEWRALDRIVYCESRWRHFNADGSILVGRIDKRDTGLGQINTWFQRERIRDMGLDPRDPYENLKLVVHIYKLDGVKPWVCSSL